MTKLVIIGVLALVGNLSAMTTDDRVQRILDDEVLRSVVKATQKKYNFICRKPTDELFAWHCLNGSQCRYVVTILCSDPSTAAPKGMQIKATGFDTGSRNDLHSVEFKRLN